MDIFFIVIEVLVPVFAFYLIWQKQDLSIVYFPFLMFCSDLTVGIFPAFLGYLLYGGLILYYIYNNPTFGKQNIFAIILVVYFSLLLLNSKDFVAIRPFFFGVLWLFLLVPLIVEIYNKYSKEQISSEISKVGFLVLFIFILNSIFSTLLNFNPYEIYNITSGILYGALSFDHLNILPFAVFIVIRKAIKEKSLLYILIYLVAMIFILLTFRRSVMALSVFATIIPMVEMLERKKIGIFFMYAGIITIVSAFVIYQTGFLDVFWERYNIRNLDNRPLQEEKRLMEFEIMYEDLFVHYDYDPWFGYELFASNGNYGKGSFGNRSLHTDFGSIVHSSGLIGFSFYLFMILTAFSSTWNRIKTKDDYLQFFFCLVAFGVFFITGRYTTIPAMTLMFCLLYLPLGRSIKKIHTGMKRTLNKF